MASLCGFVAGGCGCGCQALSKLGFFAVRLSRFPRWYTLPLLEQFWGINALEAFQIFEIVMMLMDRHVWRFLSASP